MNQSIQEQIAAMEAHRAATVARREEIQGKAISEKRSKDEAEKKEFDALSADIKTVDAELADLKLMQSQSIATATLVTAATGADPKAASDARGGTIISVSRNLPKGTGFTRKAMALLVCKGNKMEAAEYAKQWRDSTPEVEMELKSAIAAGTTQDATWAAPLALPMPLASEFIELLRPATIIGKIPNLRKVPFNVSVPKQTAGGTYGWVGEGATKPVTNLQFGTVNLGFAKAAGIIVLTEELVRVSSPSAEAAVRNDMIKGIAGFLDSQFVLPAVAPVANVSPGSITNGTTPLTTAGTSAANARTDILALIGSVLVANGDTSNLVLIMSQTNALALGAALNPLGQSMFPGMGAQGGSILGIPVITSQAAGANVILLDAQGILFADDGQVNIDVSREASLQMDSAPDSPTVETTVMVSLWQHNLVGLRAERWMNWVRATLASVKYVVATYA